MMLVAMPGVAMAGSAGSARNGPDAPKQVCYILTGCVEKGEDGKIDDTKTSSIGPSGAKYGKIISKYAREYGVPVTLAHAIIKIESNYRANARGNAGEIGLMQIKPATARMMGYRGSAKGLYDPDTNIRFGMKYLGKAAKLGGGTTCGTVLKYNAGHGAKRMNPVSAAYCKNVKRELAG